jgi:hypothetical protein
VGLRLFVKSRGIRFGKLRTAGSGACKIRFGLPFEPMKYSSPYCSWIRFPNVESVKVACKLYGLGQFNLLSPRAFLSQQRALTSRKGSFS